MTRRKPIARTWDCESVSEGSGRIGQCEER